jgi:uncharacterized membrane protein YkgB
MTSFLGMVLIIVLDFKIEKFNIDNNIIYLWGVALFGWLMWLGITKAIQYEKPEKALIFFMIPVLMGVIYDNKVFGT